MNGIMNEIQVRYCDICDKTINIKSKSKHVNTKSHKHKREYGIVVKEYEFIKAEIDELNCILIDTIKECRKKNFHSFEY